MSIRQGLQCLCCDVNAIVFTFIFHYMTQKNHRKWCEKELKSQESRFYSVNDNFLSAEQIESFIVEFNCN